jgi:hypothetical protein
MNKHTASREKDWRDFEDINRKTGSFSVYSIIQFAQNLPVRRGIEVSSLIF